MLITTILTRTPIFHQQINITKSYNVMGDGDENGIFNEQIIKKVQKVS